MPINVPCSVALEKRNPTNNAILPAVAHEAFVDHYVSVAGPLSVVPEFRRRDYRRDREEGPGCCFQRFVGEGTRSSEACGGDPFVGARVSLHRKLVQACGMGKSVLADDGALRIDWHPRVCGNACARDVKQRRAGNWAILRDREVR